MSDEVKLLPCAWRWRYVYPDRVGRWTLRQTEVYPMSPLDGFAGIEVEPLYTRAIEATDLVPAAAAIVDIWMGGDTAWRSRFSDSDFLESADWLNALDLARAAIEATRPECNILDTPQQVCPRHGHAHGARP